MPTDDSTARELLTLDQLSDLLQVPRSTLYTWRTSGKGPRALKLNGTLRFRRSDVDAWLDAATEPAARVG